MDNGYIYGYGFIRITISEIARLWQMIKDGFKVFFPPSQRTSLISNQVHSLFCISAPRLNFANTLQYSAECVVLDR